MTTEERLDALEEFLERNQLLLERLIALMEGRNGIGQPRHLSVVESP
jgi:hypothetical protein